MSGLTAPSPAAVQRVVTELVRRGGSARIADLGGPKPMPASTLARVLTHLDRSKAIGRRPCRSTGSRGRPESEVYLRLPGKEEQPPSSSVWPDLVGVSFIPEAEAAFWVRTNLRGRQLAAGRQPWPEQDRTLEGFLRTIAHSVAASQADKSYSLGLSVYGHVDGRSGKVHRSPLFRFLSSAPQSPRDLVVEYMASAPVAAPAPRCVTLDNEVRALTLQRKLLPLTSFAATGPSDCFAVVKIHYGVGAGLALGPDPTALHYGIDGLAGEIGHCQVEHGADALRCRCGAIGHVESLFQPTALRRLFEDRLEAEGLPNPLPPLADDCSTDDLLAGDDAVVLLADGSDDDPLTEVAGAVLDRQAAALGRALSYLDLLVQPGQIELQMRPALLNSRRFSKTVLRVRGEAGYNGHSSAVLEWTPYDHARSAFAAAALAAKGYLADLATNGALHS